MPFEPKHKQEGNTRVGKYAAPSKHSLSPSTAGFTLPIYSRRKAEEWSL